MRLFQGCFFIIRPAFSLKVDDLLYNNTGLVDYCLVPESYESLYDVSEESYEDEEDKESDEI